MRGGVLELLTALTLRPHPHCVTRALESAPRKHFNLPPNGHLRPWGLIPPQLRCQGASLARPPTAEPSSSSRRGPRHRLTVNSGSIGRGSL